MTTRLAVSLLVLSVVGGCSFGGGGGNADGPRTTRRSSSPSRPTDWTVAKVSYFSTQIGGMQEQLRARQGGDGPFGPVQGPSYFALVSKDWVWKDRRKAVEEDARVMAYSTRKTLRLDEPFELVQKPSVKVVENDIIEGLVDQLAEQGFFDMPAARDLAIREDGVGGYVLPSGRAWLMVQFDDWKRTVALNDLRTEQAPAFTEMKSAIALTFSAASAPKTSVVLDPVNFNDPGVLRLMGKEAPNQLRPNAEMLEDGRTRYPNAPKAERKPWEDQPTPQDEIDDFLGKRKR